MKILKEEKFARCQNHKLTCNRCECEFECTLEEMTRNFDNDDYSGIYAYYDIKCPMKECGNTIYYRPIANKRD